MRDLSKLPRRFLVSVLEYLNTHEDDPVFLQMTNEELLDAYLSKHGIRHDAGELVGIVDSLRESDSGPPFHCYHVVPIGNSLLQALKSLPKGAKFLTIYDGQVVYACRD